MGPAASRVLLFAGFWPDARELPGPVCVRLRDGSALYPQWHPDRPDPLSCPEQPDRHRTARCLDGAGMVTLGAAAHFRRPDSGQWRRSAVVPAEELASRG